MKREESTVGVGGYRQELNRALGFRHLLAYGMVSSGSRTGKKIALRTALFYA